MKLLFYEMRKNIFRKYMFVLLAIAVSLNILFICQQYCRVGIGLSEGITRTSATEGQWDYYSRLHEMLDGKITLEKVKYVTGKYQEYMPAISNGTYSTEYDPENTETGYFFGDYALLQEHFYSKLEYLVNYRSNNDKIVEQAYQNIDIFKEKENRYEKEKNQYIVRHYENRSLNEFYDFQGWSRLINYDYSDLFVLVLILLAVIPCYYNENKYKMKEIILISKNRKKSYVGYKRYALYLWACFLTAVFAASDCIAIHLLYGLSGGNVKLYALADYQYTAFNGSFLCFYFLQKALKLLGILLFIEIGFFLGRILHNIYWIYIVLLCLLAAGLYCGGYAYSMNPVRQYLAMLNPFSAFHLTDISKGCYGVCFFDHFVPWVFMFLAVQSGIWLLFRCCLNQRCMSRRKRL